MPRSKIEVEVTIKEVKSLNSFLEGLKDIVNNANFSINGVCLVRVSDIKDLYNKCFPGFKEEEKQV